MIIFIVFCYCLLWYVHVVFDNYYDIPYNIVYFTYQVYWSERLRIITPVLVRIDVLEQSVPSVSNISDLYTY